MRHAVRLVASASLLLAAAALPLRAADHGPQNHRVEAAANVGTASAGSVQFELGCRGGPRGGLALRVLLQQPDAIHDFPLSDFEGPDGVGGQRDFALWSLDTRTVSTDLKTGINGWYDGKGFVLASEAVNGKRGALHDFVNKLVDADARRLRLSVAAPGGGEPLQVSVMLAGAQPELARTAADCLAKK